MTNKIEAFKVGVGYEMSFIGDSELKVNVKILSRTKKFLTVLYAGEEKRIGVKVYDNQEIAYPCGRYSMAPSIWATKETKVLHFTC